MSNKLTIKQEKFCDKYIECGNASEAYRFAYSCSKMKPDTIVERASRLLKEYKVSTRIEEIQEQNRTKTEWNRERILNELGLIMNASIADYVKIETQTRLFDGNEVEYQAVVFKDFDELTPDQLRAVESVKQGRNGIELKLHGKSWTIERICKMCGYDSPDKMELMGKDGKPLVRETIVVEVIDSRDKVSNEDPNE